ncbi:MAG TPA: hypothetical protein VIL00_01235 [Pseudonocardiaceae bacterium]
MTNLLVFLAFVVLSLLCGLVVLRGTLNLLEEGSVDLGGHVAPEPTEQNLPRGSCHG